MKWSVVGLVVVGVFAALCATVLVGALKTGKQKKEGLANAPKPEVTILVAAKDMPASTIVEAEFIASKTVKKTEAPEEYLTNSIQIVGKVIEVPMVKGQAFKKTCFTMEGSGLHLASALPNGMRAVGVSLSNSSGLQGLLYPGSVVDVLASTSARSGGRPGSKTLLTGVRVLAIDDLTIVSPERNDKLGSRAGRGKSDMVTLMVEPEQAESLQAALERGAISLALRHPLDKAPAHQDVIPSKDEEIVPARPVSQIWQMTILRGTDRESKEFQYKVGKVLY